MNPHLLRAARCAGLGVSLSAGLWLAGCQGASAQPAPAIASFQKPFLFAYGSWDKIARVEGGALEVQTPDAKGGLGDNLQPALDLSKSASASPVVRLVVGPKNKVKTLRFMVSDAKGGSSTWNYSLEGAKAGDEIALWPLESAPLSQPTSTGDNGAANLSAVSQWQFQGDWSGDAVDVRVLSVGLQAPDANALAQRAKADERRADEAAARLKEQQDLKAKYPRGANSPMVASVAPVAGDVLAITINSGKIGPASLSKYQKQDGDTTKEATDGNGIKTVRLSRGGKEIGWLIGPQRDWLQVDETFSGDPLLEFVADDPKTFVLTSSDDANYKTAQTPLSVGRKSTPTKWAMGPGYFEMRHTLYLRLPQPLQEGKSYTVSLGDLNTQQASVAFRDDPTKVQSEAVHVQQVGYRSDDPAKRAFVSCWMGTGKGLKLTAPIRFGLVDAKTGKRVFSGASSDIWSADKPEKMWRDANFNGTDVARLDFSALQTPGTYRVVVDGVGASLPFPVGRDVWTTAFTTVMHGLYNQRSGMDIGPPYTRYRKPRDLFPGDPGVKITLSKFRMVADGEGETLASGDTGVPYTKAYGGYMDAGDWNPRRLTHMKATMAQLEAFELSPQTLGALKLNIPQDGPLSKSAPDVLREAVWEFETFHRMQEADGGVHAEIETNGDPVAGEVSWLQSMPLYVAAPDYLNNWFYASVAARLSRLVKPYDAKLSAAYLDSAVKAFNWAETDWKRDTEAGKTQKRGNSWEARDNRNLAAVELLKTTRDPKWHALFLEDSVLKNLKPELFSWGKAVQREQAFVYATLPKGVGDEALKAKAVAGVEEMAGRALTYASQNAWNLTTPDKGKPMFIGFYTGPDAFDLCRAHFLTGKREYLAGAVQAAQFPCGANPNNIVYTTGLGANPIKNALKVDAERTGQPSPPGLTTYGNVDFGSSLGNQEWITWPITWNLSKNTTPNPYGWPTAEAYWDLGPWPALNEFTVDSWTPNIALYGYLAGRK